ncbi:trypsin-like peptidase domain-containing protein [Saccharopolyspora shandongensis]|uniref:nSTAND1 domain-containing NTPase n=1 Tax=Saccharopolyspora shandongensis TaxID=418495 RepID=UPI0034198407
MLPGNLIATCAHVIDGFDDITADFPLLGTGGCAVEVVEQDEASDVAILRLQSPPRSAHPAPVRLDTKVLGHRFRVPGFTVAEPEGVWAGGKLTGHQGAGRIQMAVDPHHERIVAGFSGAPVWDEQLGGVVGMVVTRSGNTDTTAHLVPIAFFQEQVDSDRSPYLGLDSFQEADADRFHGRDAEVEKLLDLLDHQDLVAVAGASGSGKSSLVRAGLIPRLRQSGLTVVESVEETGDVLFLDQFEEEVTADLQTARAKLEQVIRRAAEQPRRPGKPAPFRVVLTLRSHSLDELVTPDTADELSRAVRLLKPMQPDELRAAIEIPAERAGLAFEAGLPEAILHDCPPGQLSLLSEVLDQLWQKRQGIWLTHEAYEELGRATGALSKRADAVLASLRPKSQERARRLLIELTRADGEGGYVRRNADLADLDEDLREIAHQLTAERLLTVQDNTVTLTHQALIDHWPTLRDWLAEDEDFLSWQSKLRDLQASGSLLTGAPLAEAVDWLRQRSADIPEAQRDLINRSESARRRGQRRWRTITAIAIALTLVSAVLAGVALSNAVESDRNLRMSNSTMIAQHASGGVDDDTVKSLQLALAAWREAPSADAYGALFQQRINWDGADHVFPSQLVGEAAQIDSSSDGHVLVVVPKDPAAQVVVWRDLLGPNPTRREMGLGSDGVYELSPNGRWLVRIDASGGLQAWDLAASDGRPSVLDTRTKFLHSRFSPNSRYLTSKPDLQGQPTNEPLRVWDLADMRELPSGIDYEYTDGNTTISNVFPSPDGRTLVTLERRIPDGDGEPLVTPVVRDRETGADLKVFPPVSSFSSDLLGNGTHLSTCTDKTMTVQDLATGAVTSRFPAPVRDCDMAQDGTGQYLTSSLPPIAIQWRTGRFFFWPGLMPRPGEVIISAPDGSVTGLDTYYGTVVSKPATEGPPIAFPEYMQHEVRSPDGRRWVTYERGFSKETPTDLVLRDALGVTLTRARILQRPTRLAFDSSGERVLVVAAGTLRVFRTDDLVLEHEIKLPRPEGPDVSEVREDEYTHLVNLPTGETLVGRSGILSFWDIRRGEQTAPPMLFEAPPEFGPGGKTGPEVVLRPQHPDQMVVRTLESVEVWNYRNRTLLKEIPIGQVDHSSETAVSADGMIVATPIASGTALIDLRAGQQLPPTNGVSDAALGISGEFLFTQHNEDIEVWNWRARRRLATVKPRGQDRPVLMGNELVFEQPGYRTTIPLDPQKWFDELCRIADREFTQAELDVLPAGASTEPPCR